MPSTFMHMTVVRFSSGAHKRDSRVLLPHSAHAFSGMATPALAVSIAGEGTAIDAAQISLV
jgi:hypothetical protein